MSDPVMTDKRLREISICILCSEPAGSPPPPRWCAIELLREVRRLRRRPPCCDRCGKSGDEMHMGEAVGKGWFFTPPTSVPDAPDAYCRDCAAFLSWAFSTRFVDAEAGNARPAGEKAAPARQDAAEVHSR